MAKKEVIKVKEKAVKSKVVVKRRGRTSEKVVLKTKLDLARNIVGSTKELARMIAVLPSRISMWVYNNVGIPEPLLPKIEKATEGKVTAKQLKKEHVNNLKAIEEPVVVELKKAKTVKPVVKTKAVPGKILKFKIEPKAKTKKVVSSKLNEAAIKKACIAVNKFKAKKAVVAKRKTVGLD